MSTLTRQQRAERLLVEAQIALVGHRNETALKIAEYLNEGQVDRAREQKLIDIAFECAIVAAEHLHGKTTEEVAEWTARQFRLCGFDTEPRGASWGVLKND